MAIVWDKNGGNWGNATTWAFWNELTQQIEDYGMIPQEGDVVYSNGYGGNLSGIITIKELNFGTNPYTGRSGGQRRAANATILNCDIIGNNNNSNYISIWYADSLTINGNVKDFQIICSDSPTLVINGNVSNFLYKCTSESNATKSLIINGNVYSIKNGGAYNGTWNLTVNGVWSIENYYNAFNSAIINYNISGILKFLNSFMLSTKNNETWNLDCTINIKESNFEEIPIRGKINILSLIIEPYSELPPQSVVLEGYEYGDKVGTLKTVPDNVTIVNLTEQEVGRVKNCATVSTVQKCFEDFKE